MMRYGTATQAMLWMTASGVLFIALNSIIRLLALVLDPFETQFLRYAFGIVWMLPFVLRAGTAALRPNDLPGQLWRGAVHTAGLLLWFYAVPHVPLAEMTALSFTGPVFIMLGATLFLGERMVAARYVAAGVGFVGVLIVVAPQLTGSGGLYALVMLAAAPLFAASFLITKALTRRDSAQVIVAWQAITVTLFTLPFAWPGWTWPSLTQWLLFAVAGGIGSAGHYAMTRAFRLADMSVTQPVRFLELLWSAVAGLALFGDVPGPWTVFGGLVILGATTWLARREAVR